VRVRFLDVARGELREAVRYYNAQRRGLGAELREEVRAAIARIEGQPSAWQSLSARTRRCLLHRFPYGVVYLVREREILIVAVAHLHREPEYWKARLYDA
jgi:plasmid stabilization system protein ParE